MTIAHKKSILKSALSPYKNYCAGYSGNNAYLLGLVMSIGITREQFSHAGSTILDSILAYDQAEVEDAYIGQINMEIVSSFCGPQGLIWGYDILSPSNDVKEDEDINFKRIGLEVGEVTVKSARIIRKATKALFGTKDKLNFPLLPGTHVPCAGRFKVKRGPVVLYSAVAIGIPQDRQKNACVVMEDLGSLGTKRQSLAKRNIVKNSIKSVLEIGRTHNIIFKEVLVDFISKKVKKGQIGCALVAAPYFLLAQKAYIPSIFEDTLELWQSKINSLIGICPSSEDTGQETKLNTNKKEI